MSEAYFEPLYYGYREMKLPFHCHLQNSNEHETMVPAHWHYYIEMILLISGRTKVHLNGKCYDFSEGDLLLINSREVHSIVRETGSQVKYIVVKFDPEVLYTTSRSVFESKYVLPFTMAKSEHQKVFSKLEILDTPIPSLITEILNEYMQKSYGFELAIRTNICRIFLWILRSWQSNGLNFAVDRTLKEADIMMLQKVFDYLDKSYMEDITAYKMAEVCNLSYSYFSRQFKMIMGKTFTEYLNYIRITEAEKLLITTDLNITEVALNTGFTNSSYFIQQFNHLKNISPKQFRKGLNASK